MSVLFLPPSAGAASVPDATETVSGKIRIATSAEATAGTNDLTAMTPAKVKSVVDTAVVGGVTYQGTFDASAPADLSNATKGDLYIISVAGTYQGQAWAVGDHLLINADMGGTLDPAKIDKVDNTDSVTSVAGRTGAVTLSTADISGLATVASTGAYSDLTGAPTLATVATTGAYSDLSGTPTLGTASAEDVGTSAGNVVQLDGSARLPAVDGSLLTGITASVAALNDVGDVNAPTPADTNVIKYNSTSGDWEAGSVAASEVSGLATVATTGAYTDLTGTPTNVSTFTNDAGYLTEANSVVLQYNSTTTATAVSTKDLHIYRLYGAGGFTLTVSSSVSNSLVLINNISFSACTISGPTFRLNGEGPTGGGTSITVEAGERRLFYLENSALWLETNSTLLDRLAGVSISSPSNGEALVYNGTSGDWENSTVSASVAALNDIGDVSAAAPSNTNVIKYNSTSGDWESGAVAYSEVTGTPTLGTASAEDVGTSAGNVVQLNGSAQLPAVDGSQLINLPSAPVTSVAGKTGAVTLVAGDISGLATVATTGAYSDLSGTPTLATVATTGAYSDLSGTPTLGTASAEDVGTSAGNVVQLDGSARLPAVDGSLLTGITASVAALNDVGDVNAPTPADTNVIKYNSTSGDWEAGSVAASEVSGLATVATTGAYTDLTGTPTNVSTFTNDAGYLTEANSVVLQYNSTTTATAVSTKDLHIYRLYGAGGFTLTVSSSVSNSLVLINNISFSACTISGPTFRLNGEGPTGGGTSITVEAGERRLFYLENSALWLETNSTLLDRLAGVSISSPSNGEALVYNGTSRDSENSTVSASVAALNDIGDVSAAAPSNTNVIKYNSTSGDWESGAVAYSEVTGTPTLGTASAEDVGTSAGNVVQLNGSAQLPAVDGSQLINLPSAPVTSVAGKTGAVTLVAGDISGLATVATTGAYSDLSGTPTLGTASAEDVGTSAGNVVQLDGSARLPAVDGSQLTNLPGSPKPNVSVSSPSTDQTLSAPSTNEEAYIYTPSTPITVNLVAAATCTSGFKYQIKNRSTNAITIDPNGSETIDGASTFSLSTQEASVTLITDGSNWFII